MPAEIAMTPFLQQIFQEIDRRAEAESRGDPTRRIQITKELTDQVTRPVLEAAIGRSGQRMGNMAGPQTRALSQTAASQRVGESAMAYDAMNRDANRAAKEQAAAIGAGATLVGSLASNWPEQQPYEPSKWREGSTRVEIDRSMQAPMRIPGFQVAPGTAQQPAPLGVTASATDPVSQSKQAFTIAEKLRKRQDLTPEEQTFWASVPDDVKQFGLMPGPLPTMFRGQ